MDDRKIVEVSEDFALLIMELFNDLYVSDAGRMIGRQLFKSGTSIGANVIESQGAESNADFIHKMHISLKEAKETAYWLRLIVRGKLLEKKRVELIVEENSRILKMLTAIIKTSKKKRRK